MFTSDLLEAQRDLEQRSQAEGYARFLKDQETTSAHEGSYATAEATKVIRGCIPLVSAQVSAWLATAGNGGKGRTHSALSTLRQFDPDTLAYIALNQVFVGVTSAFSVSKVQVHIGTVIETELAARALEEERDRKTAQRIQRLVSKQGSSRNRTRAFKKLTKELLPDREGWDNTFKVRIGEPLVNAVLQALPSMFELHSFKKRKAHTVVVVRLTDEGVALLASTREAIAWNQPIHRPMLVEPRPWESMDTGCYYDEKAARNVKLVRTFNSDHRRLISEAIKSGQMQYVLEAVNTIQATPWAINRPVMEVLTWAWEEGLDIPGLPSPQLTAIPEKLDPAVWEGMDDFERKGRRINISQLREKNRGILADMKVMERDLETAKELARYERFYLPHNLDFRGRVYPVCHFSHQRSGHIKSLFQFADGCPLGEHGGAWLCVHLANCGDFAKVSKESFDVRLQWVSDNEDRILAAASDPKATVEWWRQADDPFSFLAACFEFAGWVGSGRSPDFIGHLPVALDGSNSGIQHYSAALRAEDEAALVSLTPSDDPADMYQTVADDVVAMVKEDAAEGNPMALLALAVGIGRGLVKRNVMTFAYSSEQYGFRQQLLEDLMRPLNDMVLLGKLDRNPWSLPREDGSDDGGFQMTGYLSRLIYRSVTRTVRRAAAGMDFFKKVAGLLAHEKLPLVWTSPVGLPVMHKYSEWSTKAVKLFLYDRAVPVTDAGPQDKLTEDGDGVIRQVRANIRTRPTDKIDRDKARSAVAPNVIHSMDGAHLMLTVLGASAAGIKHLALIHDSFGTHAGRTQEFFHIIREAFVDMYSGYCPFEEVLESARASLSPDRASLLPDLPEKGSLVLTGILEADYAFA